MRKFLLLLMTFTIFLSFSACGERNSREKEEAELDAVSSSMTGTHYKVYRLGNFY